MRILITGGSGFIGTHLSTKLVSLGHEVVNLDLRAPKTSLSGVTYFEGNVCDLGAVARAIKGCSAVYHLAARVSIPYCESFPIESYETNVNGTLNVLEAIRKESEFSNTTIRLIFSSTSAVYGATSQNLPASETHTPKPLSIYGVQKLASEVLIQHYQKRWFIPAMVFRFFNVYGPGQDPHSSYSGVISIFLEALKNGENLKLHGGGVQTRDFVSVYDIVEVCSRVLKLEENKCDAIPVNVGTGKPMSIKDLAEELKRITGKPNLCEETEFRVGDILHSQADITRAEEIFNWTPSISLVDGISDLKN